MTSTSTAFCRFAQRACRFVTALESFFQQREPDRITAPEAYRYQMHVIALLVSGAVGAVPRSHVICNLRIDKELFFDNKLDCWVAASTNLGKGKAPLEIHFASAF